MSATHSLVSRRNLLRGAAVGAGGVALAACEPDHFVTGDVNAKVVSRVPDDDPHHRYWELAAAIDVALGPQDMALPLRLQPPVANVTVRALHDRERIGFLLAWDDADTDDLTVEVDHFRDACAVLLAPGPPDLAVRPMGNATTAATLLHWKADWQRDVNRGRQGIDAAFPNLSIDVYPPLVDTAPGDVEPASYVEAGATEWLPGMHVENPISVAGRTTPVEKILANGFGTTTTTLTQNARGRGIRTPTGWKVVISRPLAAVDAGETALRPGDNATCAFAVWSGAAHDAGGRKSPSVDVHSVFLEL